MTNDEFDMFLDSALKRYANAPHSDEAASARVLGRLAGPLPRQHTSLWRLPAVLLDWQFAPAWPRMAALAGCLALGFAIGLSGVDRGIQRDPGASAGDVGGLVFGPETVTGGQP